MKQKMALAAYASEYAIPQLTQNQLNIANKATKVLALTEEVTKSISGDTTAVSVIIPFVRILTKTVTQNKEDSGVRVIKAEINHHRLECFQI